MRALLLICCALALAGCPRSYAEGKDPKAQERGAHPWDAPGHKSPELAYIEKVKQQQQPEEQGGAVERRPEKGPSLPQEDSLDPAKVEGTYLVVANTFGEKQILLPPGEQDVFYFRPNGLLTNHSVNNWHKAITEGHWHKLRAGVIGMSFGSGEDTEFYGQLYRDDFLYLWNYEQKVGFWMARLAPGNNSEHIGADKFDTTRGQLSISDVVASSFSGRVTGEQQMTVSGFFTRGVLSVRWEKDDRTGTGFAMFTVSPDWKTLKGAWWIDDYEAAPFSGDWDGQAK